MEFLKSIDLDEHKLDEYVTSARDACFRTGIPFFSSNHKNDPDYTTIKFLAFTLLPSPFPRKELNFAIKIQHAWNEIFMKLSNNLNLIHEALKDVIDKDEFIKSLWNICKQVNEEGNNQPITLNIIRNDYLIDKRKFSNSPTGLSHVEINSYACGGTCIPDKIKDLHKYMLHQTQNDEYIDRMDSTNLGENIVESLLKALKLYKNPNAHILFVVRNIKYSYSDHRLVEYAIFEKEPKIKFFRLSLTELEHRAHLDDERRLFIDGHEIGLIYYRGGFDPSDYQTQKEWDARLMLERSMSIKAPKIEFQLLTFKKVQQYLYESETLERLIEDKETVKSIRSTFVRQISFKKGSNKEMFDLIEKGDWVLKPQREGGSHNYFGKDIKDFVSKISEDELDQFVFMEKINPIETENYFVNLSRKPERIKINSELGVFGITIGDSNGNILLNKYGGHLLKSKARESNEGGIMIGSGAFDSLYFV